MRVCAIYKHFSGFGFFLLPSRVHAHTQVTQTVRPLRLSYQEEREWSVILEKTEKAEAHLQTLQAKTSEVLTSEETVALYRAMGEANKAVTKLTERWELYLSNLLPNFRNPTPAHWKYIPRR